MDQTAGQWIETSPRRVRERGRAISWLHIRWRARRVRRLGHRGQPPAEWIYSASAWALWGLHR